MKKTAKLLLCVLLILSLLLTTAACRKEDKQNAAGYYILKTVSEDGEALDLETLGLSEDEAFLLLNEDGTAVLYLFDELTDLTWRDDQLRSVEGDDPLTFKLEDKLLTFKIDGTELTFKRSKDDPPDIDALRGELAKPAEPEGPVGCYILQSMTMDGETIDVETLEMIGMVAYLEFYEDGTGVADLMGDTDDFTWADGEVYSEDEVLTYTLDGDTLTLTDGEDVMVFVAGEKPETPIVIPTEPIVYPDELPEGRYYLTKASNGGTTVSGDDLVAAGLSDTYIEFRADGTGEVVIMGDVEEFTWEGTVVTDSIGDMLTYTYDGTEVSIEAGGTMMTFSKSAPAATNDPEAYWDGGWYGWWLMENGTGYYADWEGSWWDLCAEIDIDEDGYGTITLWDEDFSRDDPLGTVTIRIDTENSTDARGNLVSIDGFFESAQIGEDDWNASPYDDEYDDCLIITGKAVDGEDSYDYKIVLRPWGTRWDDMEEDLLPYYYESWYLPLLEEGAEMPDFIPTE